MRLRIHSVVPPTRPRIGAPVRPRAAALAEAMLAMDVNGAQRYREAALAAAREFVRALQRARAAHPAATCE